MSLAMRQLKTLISLMDALPDSSINKSALKRKITSPCIGVCKYTVDRQCKGCAMTKPEKKAFKKLKDRQKRTAFIQMLAGRLVGRAAYPKWARAYRNRCQKKGTICVLDTLEPALGLADSHRRSRLSRR